MLCELPAQLFVFCFVGFVLDCVASKLVLVWASIVDVTIYFGLLAVFSSRELWIECWLLVQTLALAPECVFDVSWLPVAAPLSAPSEVNGWEVEAMQQLTVLRKLSWTLWFVFLRFVGAIQMYLFAPSEVIARPLDLLLPDTCSLALLRTACNMLMSLLDLSLDELLMACWHAAIAFMSLSFGDTVGFVILLCWNCTVSLNLSLFVDLMWHLCVR